MNGQLPDIDFVPPQFVSLRDLELSTGSSYSEDTGRPMSVDQAGPGNSAARTHDHTSFNEHDHIANAENSKSESGGAMSQPFRQLRAGQLFREKELPPSSLYQGQSQDGHYFCTYENCKQNPKKSYDFPSKLRKHARNHFKPVQGPECTEERAEQNDMIDHVRVAHPFLAEKLGIAGETLVCPHCGAEVRNSREDNTSRHVGRFHTVESSEPE
ncbi:hypothetical protein QQZ08_010311 [Neonectria magnoliae]|uniref:C2H2-type domain-containing protein n=1 Tax=Neonectria magnoliae TaxID=2732573 RepID=A0ABR1HID8_9HYPO